MPRATGKTASKTARPPRQGGARLPLGAHPGNTGGKKGRSGRKPKEFKSFAVSLVRDPDFQEMLRKKALAGDPTIVKLLVEHAKGKPKQAVEVSAPGGGPLEVTVTRRIVPPPTPAAD